MENDIDEQKSSNSILLNHQTIGTDQEKQNSSPDLPNISQFNLNNAQDSLTNLKFVKGQES